MRARREEREFAASLRVTNGTAGKWRLVEVRDESRSGAPRTIEEVRLEAVIVTTLESAPENATHWSSRYGHGIRDFSFVRATGLQPHRIEIFKLSTDPDSLPKSAMHRALRYVSPPERAIGTAMTIRVMA